MINRKIWEFLGINLCFLSLSFSQQEGYSPPPPQTIQGNTDMEYGLNNQTEILPPPTKIKYRQIFADAKLYEILDIKLNNYLFTIRRLNGLYVALYPSVLFLRDALPVYAHSEFITKVMFQNWNIVNVLSSSNDFKLLSYNRNILFLEPTKKFIGGNIEVFLQRGDKKRIVELVVMNFDPYLKRDKNSVLYTTYYLVNPKPVSPQKVLEYYKNLYGYYPDKEVDISVFGVPYRIKPVKNGGNISVGNKEYSVYPLIRIN